MLHTLDEIRIRVNVTMDEDEDDELPMIAAEIDEVLADIDFVAIIQKAADEAAHKHGAIGRAVMSLVSFERHVPSLLAD